MAFLNTAARNTNTNQSNENWKATAFLNLYVHGQNGQRRKIGAIALRDSKPFEAALIKRLAEEGAIEALMAALEIDFQMADKEVSDVGF